VPRAPSKPREDAPRWLAPMTTAELADALLMGSRDAATRDRSAMHADARVHLCTYHGAKGLEFDRVIVLAGPRGKEDAEERRAFYVAMTRAGHELTLASLGDDFAWHVVAPLVDLRG